MNLDPNDYTEITDYDLEKMSDARGFFGSHPMIDKDVAGENYAAMDYRGSQIRERPEGWFICTDYFVDKDGRKWWRDRHFRITGDGKKRFYDPSVFIFGHKVKGWDK